MATHLALRSSYSLLNGMMSIPQIVKKAKMEGFGASVLSDLHVLHGALDFQIESNKHGLKAIFGLECTFEFKELQFNSILLARNNDGYQKLMQISLTLTDKKVIDLESIDPSNLILILFSENGPFETMIFQKDYEGCAVMLSSIKALNFETYLGVSHQESSFFKESNAKLIELAALYDIETTALSKVYYENKADEEAYRAIQAISKQTYLDDKTLVSAPNRHFTSQLELESLYTEKMLQMSDAIASRCNVDLLALKTSLPIFNTNQSVSNKVYLTQLSRFGLQRRLNQTPNDAYKERLNYELKVINDMDFQDYFLIVYDVIRFAKKNGIYVGPGRGSAAGSLVAYALGITEIDPMKYDLLFERFLNPERISMPDIDIDFPDDKRQLVLDYVLEKYGVDHVAHIVTFGSLRARQAFRDIARVLQVPVRIVDSASKLISYDNLRDNYNHSKRFKAMIDASEQLTQVFKMAMRVEGLPRHASLHAAGLVMSSRKLLEIVPLMSMNEGLKSIQYDMHHIEKLGLIKIDFLGLRNLSIIDNIAHQIGPEFKIMQIPLDDKKTFDLIARGETIGIFQLESDGMTSLLVKMKPRQFMDIVDTIALYRPGPMENIPLYLKNRANPNAVEYLHDDLKKLTASTNGILIYQEQIMLVAQNFAGFTLAKADILRKAMSKKDSTELNHLQEDFIQGAKDKGYSDDLAQQVFALVQKFANYGFNKSHSVAYGLIAYQMAYLKANYPQLFYNYLLGSVMGSDTKTRQYIDACRRNNVIVLGVDLQKSDTNYHIEDDKIRIPFTIIKGISVRIGLGIVEDRQKFGPYKDYYDAIARLSLSGLNQGHLQSLIQGGAFDCFNHSRKGMLSSLEEALKYSSIIKLEKEGIFYLDETLVSKPTFIHEVESQKHRLEQEYAVLGFYYSEHPALHLKTKHNTESLININVGYQYHRVIAMVEHVKHHRAKNGKAMCFLEISDGTKSLSVVIFPDLFGQLKTPIEAGQLLLLKVQMKEQDSLIAHDVHVFET